MKRHFVWLAALLIFAAGCEMRNSYLPQAGDRVAPDLVSRVNWQQGRTGKLRMRITATDAQGDERMLGFEALGDWKNPTADVEFFDADGALIDTQQVDFNHRC